MAVVYALLLAVLMSLGCGGDSKGGGEPLDGGDSQSDGSAPDAAISDSVIGLDERAKNTCVALPRPAPAGGSIVTEPLVQNGKLPEAITDMKRLSAPAAWLGTSKGAGVFVLPDGETVAQVLGGEGLFPGLETEGERGVLSIAIDPLYPNELAPSTLRAFVYFSGTCAPYSEGVRCGRLRRFDFKLTGARLQAPDCSAGDACKDLLVTAHPGIIHFGGALAFGPDGYLYVTLGDGGGQAGGGCNSQNQRSVRGKLLRLDVHDAGEAGYKVPSDNPYAATTKLCNRELEGLTEEADLSRSAPCPEVVAAGFRNPFRMGFDSATGKLWIGDVGSTLFEEVNLFEPGALARGGSVANFGWPRFEGPATQTQGVAQCNKLQDANALVGTAYLPPRFYYPWKNNRPVVAGFVYHGTTLGARFQGRYLLAELDTGNVYAITNPYTKSKLDVTNGDADVEVLTGAVPGFLFGFSEDETGELIEYGSHAPHRLLLSQGAGVPFPKKLVDTGCVEKDDPSKPVAGLVPYDVNAPLWSDGADKARYFAIPDGTSIKYAGNCTGVSPAGCEVLSDFELPIGSVAMKIFRRDGKLLETRLLMRHEDGDWAGYTYVWNAAGTDATLIDGATRLADRDWLAPSRSDCLSCHTQVAGRTLGLEAAQLNRELTYPATGRTANQLVTLSALGYLDALPKPVAQLPKLARKGVSTDPQALARAYLHTNCSHCHRARAAISSSMDLRWATPLPNMNICGIVPGDAASVPFLFAPGKPEDSLLVVRTQATTPSVRMPPLGTVRLDPAAEVLSEWIENVTKCP